MPGVAEPDIAIDIVASASGLTEVMDIGNNSSTSRPRLAARTLRLIGLDALVTAITAFGCFAVFHPIGQFTSSPVVIPMACLTVSLILSFFERGLYAPQEIVSRDLPWGRITVGWLQAVAIGTLMAVCVAAISGSWTASSGAIVLFGMWLPMFLVVGYAALIMTRTARLRFHAGPDPLNRTVIIGEEEQIHELLFRIRTSRRRGFDVIGLFEHSASADPRPTLLGLPMFGDIDAAGTHDPPGCGRYGAGRATMVRWRTMPGRSSGRISMAPVDVYIYPGMNGLNLPLRRADRPFDLPLLMACTRPIGGWGASSSGPRMWCCRLGCWFSFRR